jgi:hypothetical protein
MRKAGQRRILRDRLPRPRTAFLYCLLHQQVASLDTEFDEDAEEAWKSGIALRVRDLDSGAVQSIAWDEVRRQLRTRLTG